MFFWQQKRRRTTEQSPVHLATSLQKNIHTLQTGVFSDDDTLSYRHFLTSRPKQRAGVLIYLDNMADRELLSELVLRPIMSRPLPPRLKGKKLVEHLMCSVLPVDEIEAVAEIGQLADKVVGGCGVLLFEGCNVGIAVEARGWEKRDIQEPLSESVVRGPRAGFTEDIGVGLALLRRRVNSPALKVQILRVGERTQTKVAITYIEGLAHPKLIEEVTARIKAIKIDAVLESGYIEELIRDCPYCPLPTVGRTERPDVVVAKLVEGRVGVLVDGTPFALTLPFLFVECFQANEDYFKNWMGSSFVRFLRYLSFFMSTSVPALYLALITYQPHLIPTELVLTISASRKAVPFPAVVEVVLMGLIFEILREGGLRLPKPVGEAVSIVGAIVLGEAAVTARLVSAPMIIVVAITGIAGFLSPLLHDFATLIRLVFVILASLFGLYGYLFGLIGITIQLAAMRSFGVPYLTSLLSFHAQDFKDTMIRAPWWFMSWRPRFLAEDKVRLRKRQS